MSFHWQQHIALLILDVNFCSDSSYKKGWVRIMFFLLLYAESMDFCPWYTYTLEVISFLTIGTCFAVCRTLPCAMFLHLNFLREGLFPSLSEGGFLSVDLPFSLPIPCTDESLSSSFICISDASADRTTFNAFWSVRFGTLSNLSLLFVKFTPSTIRFLIREFFNVLNSHVSQSFLNNVTYWSMLSLLS